MLPDLGIFDRHDSVEHFDHRHLGAEVGVETGELDPDRARSDDQQFARHFRRSHCVAVGPDALAVRLCERKLAGPRAGRDDDVLRGKLGRLAVGGDAQLALTGQLPLAHHHRDLVLLHQVRDALVELLGDVAAPLHHLGEIEARLPGRQPVFVRVLDEVEHLRRAEQRLGRDAPPVEADAAQTLPLDDRRLQPQLRRTDRRDIAPRPRPQDDDIILLGH